MIRRRDPIRALLDAVALPLIVSGATVLVVEAVRRAFRRSQLFCPSPDPIRSWDPADYGIPPGRVEEHWFETPDGEELYGWYCRADRPIASALFCHGNTGNLTTSADVIPHLLEAGINVLFFDYRGFGKSSGIPSLDGVIADGVTAARYHDRIRPKSISSILYGFSLGGAVAGQVIRRHPFDGLILQSTFTDLPSITRVLYPKWPLHRVAGKLFDTLSVIKSLQVPLLVIHGEADEVIPCDMAGQLHAACPAAKQLHLINGGLHKDLYLRDADSIVWVINQFATTLPRDTRASVVQSAGEEERLSDRLRRSIRRSMRRRTTTQPL